MKFINLNLSKSYEIHKLKMRILLINNKTRNLNGKAVNFEFESGGAFFSTSSELIITPHLGKLVVFGI